MKNKGILFLYIAVAVLLLSLSLHSCKSCNKKEAEQGLKVDTSHAPPPPPAFNLPHADSSLTPVLSKALDEIFDASGKKDYAKLGSLLAYRGPDEKRMGQDVFNAKNNYERGVIKVTSDVFNKWNKGVENRQYARVYELDQPDGSKMPVVEVIFLSKLRVERKFFGFYPVKENYKLVDVISSLEPEYR